MEQPAPIDPNEVMNVKLPAWKWKEAVDLMAAGHRHSGQIINELIAQLQPQQQHPPMRVASSRDDAA